MNQNRLNRPHRCGLVASTVFVATVIVCQLAVAQTGTLAEPFPAPAPNAALHYQRGLLHLAKLDASQTASLSKPIWEVLPDPSVKQLPQDVTRLLFRARFAVGSATSGSRMSDCNFGIDFSELGAAAQLPHVDEMIRLGRLLTLRGAQAEARADWEEAVIIYFDGLCMGRHLTHQHTLLEALAGIEILRNNYHALANWAARCPARLLGARAFGLLESMQSSLVDPSQIIAREASIMALDFRRLDESYPDGHWPQMILDSYGESVTGDSEKDRVRAIKACVDRGVPESVFKTPEAFHQYLSSLQATSNRFVESVAACMALPPNARLKRSAALNKKYSIVIPVLASDTLIDPADIGVLFAQHEAELTLTRIALAASASIKEKKFPESLDAIAARFGGAAPADPYRNSPVTYRTHDDGRAFFIEIVSLGRLPGVSFDSQPPQPVN